MKLLIMQFSIDRQIDREILVYTQTDIFDRYSSSRNGHAVVQLVEALKVAGSILDKVIGFFNRPNPSSRTMTPGSTQPLTEMSTNIPGGKGRPAGA
jgi:hypothetical protein